MIGVDWGVGMKEVFVGVVILGLLIEGVKGFLVFCDGSDEG